MQQQIIIISRKVVVIFWPEKSKRIMEKISVILNKRIKIGNWVPKKFK